MSNEALIALRNTVPKYLKGAADKTIRNRFYLSYLQKEGRIKYKQGGTSLIWNVQAREPSTQYHSSGVGVTYTQGQYNEQLEISWSKMIATDALDLFVQMINKEPYALVNLFDTRMDGIVNSLSRRLARELYIGNTSDTTKLVGLATPMVPDGSVSSDDLVAVPSSSATYGGKSVQLGALGGTWSADLPAADRPSSVIAYDWPYGSGSSEYDYLTPKMLNYTSSKWGPGATTFEENCEHMIRSAMTFTQSLNGTQATPDCLLFSTRLFDQFRNRVSTTLRLNPSDYGRSLGFGDKILNYEGAMVYHDFDCPANKGYAINAAEMELLSIADDLFFSRGPEFDNRALANEFLVGFFGQLRVNPKCLVEFGAYGS